MTATIINTLFKMSVLGLLAFIGAVIVASSIGGPLLVVLVTIGGFWLFIVCAKLILMIVIIVLLCRCCFGCGRKRKSSVYVVDNRWE